MKFKRPDLIVAYNAGRNAAKNRDRHDYRAWMVGFNSVRRDREAEFFAAWEKERRERG